MQINKININPNIFYLKKQNNFMPKFCGLQKDVFEKSNISFAGVPFGINDSIKENMKNTSSVERETKMTEIVDSTKRIAEKSYEMAKLTEEMLDKSCGKDNWVFISIGTSPAGIGKALELRGHDVRYLPISGLRHINDDSFLNLNNHPEYIKFLNSINLKKDKINKDNKHYIFADYTYSGKTLGCIKDAAHSEGISDNNAHFISLNNELQKYAETKNDKKLSKKIDDYFENYCMTQQIEYYAGIPHIPYYETYLIESKTKAPHIQTSNEKGFETALCYYYMKDMESEQN